MNFIFRKLRNLVITLRFSILSIFVSFFVITILILITISYWRASQSMVYIANQLMHKISQVIITDLNNRMSWAQDGSQLSAELIENNVIDTSNEIVLIRYFFRLIQRMSLAQAIHWTDANGNFFIMERELDGRVSVRITKPIPPPNMKIYYYKNENSLQVIQEKNEESTFDPRVRNWYKAAIKEKKNIWTNIYHFAFKNLLGITTATPVYRDGHLLGVFGIDLRLDFISQFITTELFGNGIPFIVTTSGKIIALPRTTHNKEYGSLDDIHTLNNPEIIKSFDLYKKTGKTSFSFSLNGKTYLASYTLILYDVTHDWLVGIIVPQDDFTSYLKQSSIRDIFIGFFVLALGILLVSKLVTHVVRPINKLVRETNQIKNFNLSGDSKIKSRIKEVMELSNAIHSMKVGLRSFQKYVPATLVRQLIETGEGANVGGTKKTLTILFSDIKDFTTIAETMGPNELMDYMCEYYDELSKVIEKENGTIDKYIGDSIMAFWGAPLVVDDPCQRAMRVALECMRNLEAFNKKWTAEGRPPLITRMGVHTGEAIVGNLGSSKRINYTVLGDSINIASRLESINKIYGSRIIISKSVYDIIKNEFITRKIDHVAVKGKVESNEIFELLAKDKSELSFDIDSYQHMFTQGFIAYEKMQWDEAIEYFKKCLVIYPLDTIAPVFIDRCQTLKLHPPHNWDGVWRISWSS